jgi:hypothetical protein
VADERWWWRWLNVLAPYGVLIRAFVDGALSGEEFEIIFLTMQRDGPGWSGEAGRVLDELFFDVDDFDPDPDRRALIGGIDEAELRVRAAAAFARLSDLATR